ncbi:MAG: magnesium/cobalt transporter CorA [Planctomycetota bacterium]
MDYCADRCEVVEIDDVDVFLERPKPDWVTMRWINVNGLHPYVINRFRERFGYHTLAAEDVLNVPQRPKVEDYDNHVFVVARMVRRIDQILKAEQVSMFVSREQVVVFNESDDRAWAPILERIRLKGARIRARHGGYLTYALFDAMIDHYFPTLEYYGDALEQIEDVVLDHPTPELLQRIHRIKRDLTVLRRVIWPMREVIDALQNDEQEIMSDTTQTYMRDVYDHAMQVVDLAETYRDMAAGMTDLYMSSVSNRMNEIMKVLTIMATLFIPITFIAGVYGMNFEYIPELKSRYAYPIFWFVCIGCVGGLIWFFHRKGWLGSSKSHEDQS